MGGAIRKLRSFFEGAAKRVAIVGLDGAGKTTVVYRLKLGETICTMPTIGFNIEEVRVQDTKILIWDLGGQEKLRSLWAPYYQDADAVIYVLDSTDDELRLSESREELLRIADVLAITHKLAVFLILANKQDLPGAKTPAQLVNALNLSKFPIKLCPIHGSYNTVQPVSN